MTDRPGSTADIGQVEPSAQAPVGAGGVGGWPAPAGWERYLPVERIGAGGMGTVFKGWDPHLRRHVALKFFAGAEEAAERFLREAQAQARVDHPGICKVYEVGEAGPARFIAMQLIDGRPLGSLAPELSVEQRVLVLAEVAEAVHAAHRSGLIHRDIKPANVMVERAEDGRLHPFVVDFGLVRDTGGDTLTLDGLAVGTPSYMAPEQARGEVSRIDRRTDVWGLGATLYAILAGQPPFPASTPVDVLRRVLDDDPVPLRQADPSVPVELECVVMKCLEKDPERRYDSARALAEDLRRFLDGAPVQARPGGRVYRIGKWVRRNRTLAAVVLVAAAAVIAAAGATVHARWAAARQAALAQRLGEEAKEIESLMRFAHLLPRHDTGPERRMVRERIAALEARLPELGAAGRGPARAALGRAALAISDLAAARGHLERAWEDGYREPEVAYASGLVLARLYEREAQAAERIASREARELRGKELDASLRQPARVMLAASRGARIDAPEYLDALLARLDGRYPASLEHASAAAARLPWLYEALALAGDVHVALARAEVEDGALDAAAASFEQAISAYERAARVGASDGDVLAALAECRLERMRLEESRGGQTAELFDAALAAADAALAADPDAARPWVIQALACEIRANFLASHPGEDPTPLFERAAWLADAALARAPADGEAHRVKGTARADFATYLVDHGQDPRPALDEAIAALGRALAVNPRAVSVHNHLGICHWNLGVYQAGVGLDPLPAYRDAEASFRAALDVVPTMFSARGNLAGLQQSIAEALQAAGEDPRPVMREAIASYGQVIALRPGHPLPHSNLAAAHLALGAYLAQHGGDPGGAFEQAVAACRAAHEADPAYVLAYVNMGEALAWIAQLGWARGEDVRAGLAAAVAELEAGARIRPTHPGSLGAALIRLAEHELAHGRDPRAPLARARRVLDDAIAAAPGDAAPLAVRARAELAAARVARARGGDPRPSLAAARDLAARVASLRGADADTRALVADAWRLEAEAARSPALAAAALAAGLEHLAGLDPRRSNAWSRAAGAALRVLADRAGAPAACADLAAALDASPVLRPDYASVTPRCR